MKTVHLTPCIRFNVPAAWSEVSSGDGAVRLRTSDGGSFSVQMREFRKPAKPGTGSGPTSEEMLSMQVSQFGARPRVLAAGRAYATHSIPIGEPGQEKECQAWHIVNQVGPWHHETLLFMYEPGGNELDQSIVALLDREIPVCEFSRVPETGFGNGTT